jgi:hypothetical protein
MEGGCTCRQIRYRLTGTPLIVHACHCRWCQRETGTAHALNALYEADRVVHTADEPEIINTPSASGRGQKIARCPTCKVAIWSNYPQAGPAVRFVRVGTLDDPDRCPPDIHIFTSSKQPWVTLPPGAKAVPEFYDLAAVWSPESLERHLCAGVRHRPRSGDTRSAGCDRRSSPIAAAPEGTPRGEPVTPVRPRL